MTTQALMFLSCTLTILVMWAVLFVTGDNEKDKRQ